MRNAGAAGPGARARQVRRAVLFSLLALFVLVVGNMPTGYLSVYPGPVTSLEGLVTVGGRPSPSTSFRMVTVVAEDASVFGVVRAVLDPAAEVWAKNDVYHGMSPDEYAEVNEALMVGSQSISAYLAFKACGYEVRPGGTSPLPYTVESGEALGPSAGLAFSLEMVSRIAGEDLTRGRVVAATGVLDSAGNVAPVGGIAQKAIACRESGVQVFLVPAANAEEASRNAGPMTVAGVRNLAAALEFLRAP